MKRNYIVELVGDYWQVTLDGVLLSTHSLKSDADKAVREYSPYRIRVLETRTYEFEVEATDKSSAITKSMELWCAAATVGQWEVDATECEFEAAAITYEPGALPRAEG